jgi:predicted amidohydrolase YtcJ
MPADLLVTGRIASLAGEVGPGWVEAIAVTGGRVVAAGTLAAAESAAGPGTRHLAIAPDEVAIPGIVDAHLHLAEAAVAAHHVDLGGAADLAHALALVAAAHEALRDPDAWLEGHGWDMEQLGGWPLARDLDRVAPDRRVALWAHDHHALWASSRALTAAGIGPGTPDPDGGLIRRLPDGTPAGVVHEAAAGLVADVFPSEDAGAITEALRAFVPELLALGITGAHDPGSLGTPSGLGPAIEAYGILAARGELGLRVHASVRAEQLGAALEAGFHSGAHLGPDPMDHLRAGWLKLFADGTLGSRTAAMLQPFATLPGEPLPPNDGFGIWLTSANELAALVTRAAAGGIASQIHAIGDAAVRAALDALEPTVGTTPLLPRVEHVQLMAAEDRSRFASAGIAASVQPVHLRSDAALAQRLWGDRAESRGYAYRTLAASGALIPFGTDAPVEPPDPWPGLVCAVTRRAPGREDGTLQLGPQEALPLWRAIRAACLDGPRSAGLLDVGQLVPGARADLIVVPAAGLEEPVEPDGPLGRIRPRLVLLDGAVAHEA